MYQSSPLLTWLASNRIHIVATIDIHRLQERVMKGKPGENVYFCSPHRPIGPYASLDTSPGVEVYAVLMYQSSPLLTWLASNRIHIVATIAIHRLQERVMKGKPGENVDLCSPHRPIGPYASLDTDSSVL
ncbi:hypothetical protein J6590_001684 [Homalodisca vitripennis]|nr:hypothetical protein J6590_001684 [Homalodisca vitripennis]